MQMLRGRLLTAGFTLLALTACGGGDGTTGPGGGGGSNTMAAQIDGQSWTADGTTAAASAVVGVPGGYVILGTQVLSSSDARSISISLYNIGGPGTYALGVLPMVFGGIATIGEASGAWLTPLDGTAGTITITALSATRIAGTFSFTAAPGAGTAGGPRTVTAGHFDLPLKGTATPVPDQAGSRVAATLGGTPYNASTVAVTMSGSSGLQFSTVGGDSSLTVTLTGVTAPGTYPLSTGPSLVAVVVSGKPGASQPVWGATATDVGSITVTSLTATRAKGTFSVTLAPERGKGSSTLVVSNGQFDVGIQ